MNSFLRQVLDDCESVSKAGLETQGIIDMVARGDVEKATDYVGRIITHKAKQFAKCVVLDTYVSGIDKEILFHLYRLEESLANLLSTM
jgi:hypothetical protein